MIDKDEFVRITNELIAWMNKNCSPHQTIIVDNMHAEVLEGCLANYNDSYIRD